MDEPVLRVWMQDPVPPRTDYEERPGRRVAESSWSLPKISVRTKELSPGRLGPAPAEEWIVEVQTPQVHGVECGFWCPYGGPPDQETEGGLAVGFTSESLSDRIEISRGEWRTRVEPNSVLTADGHSFLVTNRVEGYAGEVRVFAKSWTKVIPRDHS